MYRCYIYDNCVMHKKKKYLRVNRIVLIIVFIITVDSVSLCKQKYQEYKLLCICL